MRRTIIINENGILSLSGSSEEEIWMTSWEIAGLFNVTTTAVNSAVKAIRKSDVLKDYEVCRYAQLENGLYADVYSLEIIIPIAFRLDTYYTHAFRSWLVKKAVAGDGRKASYVMFMRAKKENWN